MKPTEELVQEHNGIKRMLRVLEVISGKLDAGERVDPNDLDHIVEFIQIFADKCHHGKEEDLLFKAMEHAGIPCEGGPIGVMLEEHRLGRGYVKGMSEAAAAYRSNQNGAGATFAQNARNYVALLSQHIAKEDGILYVMADRVLTPRTQADLLEGFEQIEEERVGHGKHEEFHRLLDRLDKVYPDRRVD